MRVRSRLFLPLFLLLSTAPTVAQAQKEGQPEPKPLLRLEAGGPTSNVTALAFSPDGKLLYAAGHDKVVRVWALNKAGAFVFQEETYYRVPVGPGHFGAINALALSDDGTLLAVGGYNVTRLSLLFDDVGGVGVPSAGLPDEARQDIGAIYVFDTRQRKLRQTLRGHRGEVRTLTFAPSGKDRPPLLVSAARVRDDRNKTSTHEIHVWNLAAKAPLVARLQRLPVMSQPPALAVWPTGGGPTQLRVAIALTDGKLRIWDVGGNAKALVVPEKVLFNSTLVAFPGTDGNRLLAGGTLGLDGNVWKGQLRTWDVTGAQPQPGNQVVLAGEAEWDFAWVKALSLFKAKAGGPDHAALVVGDNGKLQQYALEVRGPDNRGAFARRKAWVPLWGGTNIWPVLATSRRGGHIAVAGNPDHRILVFPVAGLLGGAAGRQEIRSVGTSFLSARFVRRGQGKATKVGLVLGEAPGPNGGPPGVLTFNFGDGTLAAGKAGWQPDELPWPGWTTQLFPPKGGKRRLVVWDGEQEAASLSISATWEVGECTVVPPGKAAKEALLIVALFEPDTAETAIDVYNLKTREHFLRLTGHQAPVRSLSVSQDARLLASAAADQTVCVWSLSELAKPLSQVGGAPGLVVVPDKGGERLVVVAVEADNKGTQNLTAGMVIEGLVRAGKVQPLKTPEELHAALWATKPGQSLTLRAGKDGALGNVTVTVAQVVAEHTPLLTLFVTRAAQGGQRDWVGWSPSGAYDASRRAAEGYLGWHYNTGKPADPTSFAPIEQGRKKFYKKGLLDRLTARANLEKALQDLVPPLRPPPVLAFTAFDADKRLKADAQGQLLVRNPTVALQLEVRQYERRDDADVAEWQLDGGKAQPLTREGQGSNVWSAVLKLPPDKGGIHVVEAAFRLRERQDAPARSERLKVRYQPPAPTVELAGPADPVKKAAFPLRVRVRPGVPGADVEVTVRHDHPDVKAPTWEALVKDADGDFTKVVVLKEGQNSFTVRARNRGALAGFEKEETDERPLRVTYDSKPAEVARPKITLGPVLLLTQEGAQPALSIESGRTIAVTIPKLRFKGTIEGKEALGIAVMEHIPEGAEAIVRKLAPVSADKKACPIAETLNLVPGLQTVRFRAKTANSPEALETVRIDYRPLLPRSGFKLQVARPAMPGLIFYEDEPRAARTMDVTADLPWPKDRYAGELPLQATVLIDGKAVPGVKAVVSAKGERVTAHGIPLGPRENHIQIRLTHAWGGDPSYGYVHVRYFRPPQLLAWDKPAVDAKKPFALLKAHVWSVPPLSEDKVRVSVNGERVQVSAVDIAPDGADKGKWLVTLKGVPLPAKANTIRLKVRNAEGESRADEDDPKQAVAVTWVEPVKPLPKPPVITVLAPTGAGRNVSRREVKVHFLVESEVPLTGVALWQGEQSIFQRGPQALKTLKPIRPGFYEFKETVPLEWGLSEVRLEAANDGRKATQQLLTVSAVRKPVEVVFDALDVPGGGSAQRTILPRSEDGSATLRFGQAPLPRAYVLGRVLWPDEDFKELNEAQTLRLYVNGFQQHPAVLEPRAPGSLERKFKAPVVLGLAQDNQVEVALPGLEHKGDSRTVFAVDCAAPGNEPTVHVVVIAPREYDATAFQKGLNLALAKASASKLFKVKSYAPLTRESGPSTIARVLVQIHKAIKSRTRSGFPTNDLLLVYYQGTETVREDGRYFWTGDTGDERNLAETALNLRRLARQFDDFLGAQVLLLDVTAPGGAKAGAAEALKRTLSWLPPNRGLAMLRHSWPGAPGAPGNGQLLQEVGKAMPRASGLHELDRMLSKHFREQPLSQQRDRYLGNIPRNLKVRFAP